MSGIVDITAEAYHADEVGHDRPSLSASIAHTLITSSPLHAWTQHPRLNPHFEREHDDKFDLGTVAHAALLQGMDIAELVDAKDWRTKAAQESAMLIRAAGRIPLLPSQWERVQAMVVAAREQLGAQRVSPAIFTDGAPEQSLVWEDDGVLCRARVDWLRYDLSAVDDYKSTGVSAHPRTWSSRTMFTIGADVQVAFYLRGLQILHPELRQRPAWRYVVQETFAPYALSVVEIGEDVITLGMDKVERALAIWRDCLAKNVWPAYPSEPVRAELPAWVEAQWLERAA